jgi:hypothetical protein
MVPEIGRRMGCTKQAVYQLLRKAKVVRAHENSTCRACGAVLCATRQDMWTARALCLNCLDKISGVMFGERLRAHRIARGLSRRDIAQKARVCVTTATLLEQHQRRPQPGTLRKLAAALGVEPGELLPGERRRG